MSCSHLTVTPKGLQLAGITLAKRNRDGTLAIHEGRLSALLYAAYGKTVSPQAMRYFKSAGELMAQVKDSDWNNQIPHQMNDVPILAHVGMRLALAGFKGLHKAGISRSNMLKVLSSLNNGISPETLIKVIEKDFAADDPGDDEYDGSSDTGGGSGNGNYNPDEPRIPAGKPGGGQWTTGGTVASETTPDRGNISADGIRTALRDGFDNPSPSPQQDGTNTPGDGWANVFNGRWGSAPNGIADTYIQANQHHEGFDNMLNTRSSGTTPMQILNSKH